MSSAQTHFKGCKISGNATVNTAGGDININQNRTVHNESTIQNNNFVGATITNSTAAVMGNVGPQEGLEETSRGVEQTASRERPDASSNLKQEETENKSYDEPAAKTVFEDCAIDGNPNFNTAKKDININRSTKEHNNCQEQTNNFKEAKIKNSTVAVMGDVQKGTTSQQVQDRNVPLASRPTAQRQVTNAQGATIEGSIFGVMGNVTETNWNQ